MEDRGQDRNNRPGKMSEGRKEGRTWEVTEDRLWEIRGALQVGCYLSIFFFIFNSLNDVQ